MRQIVNNQSIKNNLQKKGSLFKANEIVFFPNCYRFVIYFDHEKCIIDIAGKINSRIFLKERLK